MNKYICQHFMAFGALKISPLTGKNKKGLCGAVNQRDDGELNKKSVASTEFGEILIYLPVRKKDNEGDNRSRRSEVDKNCLFSLDKKILCLTRSVYIDTHSEEFINGWTHGVL
ncbi:hypothetical protein AMECASPLE_039839 [Ameca splendens]|uniref:Uncharacterized protein n=1 Tax=Ameca splendens TaxID=208324 RepID=A0ABV0XXV7_9TELE